MASGWHELCNNVERNNFIAAKLTEKENIMLHSCMPIYSTAQQKLFRQIKLLKKTIIHVYDPQIIILKT
jgi:hypothetical protein